jgi:hypothetical protein
VSWLLAGALALVLTVGIGQAAVWTDKADYSPGEVVTINGDNSDGAGYAAGETVQVDVSGPSGYTSSCNGVADSSGAWSCQVTLNADASAVGSYSYTATGQTSGVSESGTFTDAPMGAGSLCANVSGFGSAICGDLSSANVSHLSIPPGATHYIQLAGTSADYRIVGATDASDVNGDGCLEAQIRWTGHGSTTNVCATRTGNNLDFSYTARLDGCNVTDVFYEAPTGGSANFRPANADIVDDGAVNASAGSTAGAGIGFGNSSGNLVQCDRMTNTSTTLIDDATGNPVTGPLTAPASVHDTATVTSSHVGLTGSVEFLFSTNGCDGPFTSVGTVAINTSSNTATVSSQSQSNLGPGFYAFKAVFHGGGRFSDSVSDCEPFTVGGRPEAANPTITKTAEGSYDRECDWTITKSVDPSKVTQTNGSPAATFNYTVKVSATCNRIEKTQVSGTITVLNPNAGPITISSLADTLSDSTGCTVTPTVPPNAVIPANGSVDFAYTCSLPQYDNTNGTAPPSDLTNKACVGWPDQDVQGDGHLAGPGSACTDDVPVTFTETLTDECVDVSDPNSPNPPLPDHFCVGAAGGDKTYTYSKTYSSPAVGSCADHDNTASFVDNSTPQNRGSASKTVRVCNYGSRLTPGYWKNHLAPNGSTGCRGLPSGTSCSSNGPWANQDLSKVLGTYAVNTILKAAQVFAAMNCSSSSSQNAIGCLAGHLLAAKYNRNINTSDPCIDSVIATANAFLIAINYTGPTGNYSGITAAQRNTAISLKNQLDAYNNGGGCST